MINHQQAKEGLRIESSRMALDLSLLGQILLIKFRISQLCKKEKSQQLSMEVISQGSGEKLFQEDRLCTKTGGTPR